MSSTVLVAMSGGVDSSVAAAMLIDSGYEVVGVTMKMHDTPESRGAKAGCCTVEDADDARAVAGRLGIPYYVVDLSEPFGDKVIDHFVGEYARGRTPNPCVECNRHIKFAELITRADLLGADFVATGHHARLVDGAICRGRDRHKDQSYVLACIDRSLFDRVLLPIGDMTKADVRLRAADLELRTADKAESMEVCFLGAAGKDAFLQRRLALGSGAVVDERGEQIGHHEGAALYTIGQRRGLGVAAGTRKYVHSTEVDTNVVRVTGVPRLAASAVATDPTWHAEIVDGAYVGVQTSAHGRPERARLFVDDENIEIDFDAPVPAPAPGQLAAFYLGDRVVGGATIASIR